MMFCIIYISFGRVQTTPTGSGNNLPTIVEISTFGKCVDVAENTVILFEAISCMITFFQGNKLCWWRIVTKNMFRMGFQLFKFMYN